VQPCCRGTDPEDRYSTKQKKGNSFQKCRNGELHKMLIRIQQKHMKSANKGIIMVYKFELMAPSLAK